MSCHYAMRRLSPNGHHADAGSPQQCHICPLCLAALEVVQRRFQISQGMIFTGLKATIPPWLQASLAGIYRPPAPILLRESKSMHFEGKIQVRSRLIPLYQPETPHLGAKCNDESHVFCKARWFCKALCKYLLSAWYSLGPTVCVKVLRREPLQMRSFSQLWPFKHFRRNWSFIRLFVNDHKTCSFKDFDDFGARTLSPE